jgi:hypothetical protein
VDDADDITSRSLPMRYSIVASVAIPWEASAGALMPPQKSSRPQGRAGIAVASSLHGLLKGVVATAHCRRTGASGAIYNPAPRFLGV